MGRHAIQTRCHAEAMPKIAYQKRMDAALPAVTTEMAKPRITKSARIAELNLDAARIRTEASTTVPGTVDKIVPGNPSQPEKADVSLDGTDSRRTFRIENTLTDEHGDKVGLKKGARVQVIVTDQSET
jgi:hypothetical protein